MLRSFYFVSFLELKGWEHWKIEFLKPKSLLIKYYTNDQAQSMQMLENSNKNKYTDSQIRVLLWL